MWIKGLRMVQCKGCQSDKLVKNGIVRREQRYRCKGCGLNFIEGDKRKRQTTVIKKALCILLYSLGKASFSMLGRILGHSPALIYRWIVEAMEATPEPVIDGEIKEIEFDEMWHFIGSKKTKFGSSKPWIVAQGELLPGLPVVVMLQPLESSMIKSGT
jgi:transposase-like protein